MRNTYRILALMVLVAMLASACAAPVAPAPAAAPPTTAPVATAVPPAPAAAAFDLAAVVDKYITSLPDGFGGIKPDKLNEQMAAAKPFILDVREAAEIEKAGTLDGAVNIPLRTLTQNLDKLPAKDQPIVTLCAIGHRGGIAMTVLQMLGYTNVKSLSGGFTAWTNAKLPTVPAATPAVAGAAPEVDKDLLAALDKYVTTLPDGFGGIKAEALNEQIAAAKPFLLDVREPKELTDAGKIEGAVNVPLRTLTQSLAQLPSDKGAPIVVYCAVGHRGSIAMTALQLLGYTNVKSLSNGLAGWTAANLPLVK